MGDSSDRLIQAAEQLQWMARRWSVSDGATAEDAMICDAAIRLFVGLGASFERDLRGLPEPLYALPERQSERGMEELARPFQLPVSGVEAVTVLHRYARRYAHGRSGYAASRCNDATKFLLALGTNLEDTRRDDGSVWALGNGDLDDHLTPEQREEASQSKRFD